MKFITQFFGYFANSGPLSQKTLGATIGAFIFGALSWVATTWIWPHGVPVGFKPVLTWLAPILGAFIASWLAKHRVTPGEVERAIAEATQVMQAIHPDQVTFRSAA